jgi:hypothetical protein
MSTYPLGTSRLWLLDVALLRSRPQDGGEGAKAPSIFGG